MKLRIAGTTFDVEPTSSGVRLRVAERTTEYRCEHVGAGLIRVHGPDGAVDVWIAGERAGAGGESALVVRERSQGAKATGGALTPPMPATVGRVLVGDGERVTTGQALIVLVAMKTEITLRAPRDGIVVGLRAVAGQTVRPGDRLVRVESEDIR